MEIVLYLRRPSMGELAPELFDLAVGGHAPNVFRLPRGRGARQDAHLMRMAPAFTLGHPVHPAEVEGVQTWLDDAFEAYGQIIARCVAGGVLRVDRHRNESDQAFHGRCEELIAAAVQGD